MRRANASLTVTALLLYAFLYAPIVVVIVFSFNAARFGAGWQGFTTQWYRTLLENPLALSAAKNTLLLACVSTIISTALGTMLGYALNRWRFRARQMIANSLYVPIFLPDIVMAVSILMFYMTVWQWFGIFELGMTTMVVAHVTFQIPFVAIVVRSRLVGLDRSLEEAARDLGADGWQTFRRITFPLMFPGVLAAAMLAFTLSLDDFVVSFFTSGPGSTTLPILIYSSVKRGITPDINALSTLIISASIVALGGVTLLQKRSTRSA